MDYLPQKISKKVVYYHYRHILMINQNLTECYLRTEKSYNIYLKISEQYANIKSQITINSKTNTITICDCDIAIKNINKGDEIYRTYCVEWLYKLFKNITFDKYISYISNDKTKVNKYRDILENNFMYMQNYFVKFITKISNNDDKFKIYMLDNYHIK